MAVLGRARLGMLAVNTGRWPLVNPAAFHFASGSLWMTTSRYAAKVSLARRDPRAAFLADGGSVCLLLQGVQEAYDLRSLRGQLRAALEGPGFYWSLAGYAAKNAPFVAGYLLDLTAIPSEWWPQNRVVLRLRPSRATLITAPQVPAPAVTGPAGLPRALWKASRAYVCWTAGGAPALAPALWAPAGAGAEAVMQGGRGPRAEGPGALVVESHHPYRPSLVRGACLRGRLRPVGSAVGVMRRYGTTGGGTALRLEVRRITEWRGFQVVSRSPRVRSKPDAQAASAPG